MDQFECGRRGWPGSSPLASPLDDPEVRERVAAWEREIAALAQERAQCEAEIRSLITREAAGEGPFAQPINALKQRKMMLATEAQHRKVLINGLLLGSG